MKLTVQERMMLRNILPQEGNIVTVRLVAELQQSIAFTEEETLKYEIRTAGEKYTEVGVEKTVPPNQVRWNDALVEEHGPAEIDICPTMHKLIKEELVKMDQAQKLTAQHLAVYDKFCLENPPPEEEAKEEVTDTPAVAAEEGA